MKRKQIKRQQAHIEENTMFGRFSQIIIFLIFTSAFFLVTTFKPMSKEDHIESFNKMNKEVEPFRKNLSECAREVHAKNVDVENFLKRVPQSTFEGKCFVACILKRNSIIVRNKIVPENLLEANRAVYGDDSEVMSRLKKAISECNRVVDGIFEICEYASMFNDCMHMKMEHILDKVMMERRMEALGQMTSDADEWSDEEDEILKLVKDEL